jgi:SAM-dependent methyltransferase
VLKSSSLRDCIDVIVSEEITVMIEIEDDRRQPEDRMLTLNEWISKKIKTDNWYVGESNFALATPLSLDSYESMRAEYSRLYGAGSAIGAVTPAGYFEIMARFADLLSWKRWLDANRWVGTPEYAAAMVSHIRLAGMFDPLQGYADPSLITIDEGNLRESILFRGLNSRYRAVLRLLIEAELSDASVVYAPESVTGLANVLRNHFRNFIASEYLPAIWDRVKMPNTRHEDIQNLSFADASIDAYFSCEVMEHIPSVRDALCEAARVLRTGGIFIATFPFRTVEKDTLVKAVLENGQIRFLTEPEYHGNPVNSKGSLVFSIPGWDILDTARASGFSNVEMVAISSRLHGIVAQVPVLVMRAVR